jgi:hypothetical protein
VTAGPWGETAAARAGRGHLRAPHADREQVVDMLKVAFVDGRLTKDELETRAGRALASPTCEELAALTADLPAGLIVAPVPCRAARARAWPSIGKVVAGAALIVPLPALLMTVFLTTNDRLARFCLLIIPWYFVAWIVAGVQLLDWWLRPSHEQSPPGQPGQALREGRRQSRLGSDLMLREDRRVARPGVMPGRTGIRSAWRSRMVRLDRHRPARLQAA